MLTARVPLLLAGSPQGPYWARLVLEKLVSLLTGAVTSGAPLLAVRDAVSLVAKFFLQNLHTLQRHDCFGQLWLMVLRLTIKSIKRRTMSQSWPKQSCLWSVWRFCKKNFATRDTASRTARSGAPEVTAPVSKETSFSSTSLAQYGPWGLPASNSGTRAVSM